MPAHAQHRRMTENALRLVPRLSGDRARLVSDFCLYPDRALETPELSPYCRLPDGALFHYLPDLSYAELYRYYEADETGRPRLARPFVNANYEAAAPGFLHLLTQASARMRAGEADEALKYAGVLLHVLQDAGFGLHALEGPGGSDLFYFERLNLFHGSAAGRLAELDCTRLPDLDGNPRPLGDSPEEAALLLYAGYCRLSRASRRSNLRILCEDYAGRDVAQEETAAMFAGTVRLCADVLGAVDDLAAGRRRMPEVLSLTELEPVEFPVGGSGAYRFRSLEYGCFLRSGGGREPLEFGDERFSDGISFGLAVGDRHLRYCLPAECFRRFSAKLRLAEAPAGTRAALQVYNDGRLVDEETIGTDGSLALEIDRPRGRFGISLRSAGLGVAVIGDPLLWRNGAARG